MLLKNPAYGIAKNGGKHRGTYNTYKEKSVKELQNIMQGVLKEKT